MKLKDITLNDFVYYVLMYVWIGVVLFCLGVLIGNGIAHIMRTPMPEQINLVVP